MYILEKEPNMPRSIEFDMDATLTAAMDEFRHLGFGGTSIKALERATGLTSGSLYNSFGDKDAIFARALSHYNHVVVAARIRDHMSGKAATKGLRSLFLSLLQEPDGGSSGCLLTNSAIEFGSAESIAREGVSEGFQLLEDAFRTAVAKFRSGQEAVTTLKLLALYQGVLVLVRLGHPKPLLRALINREIDDLTGGNNA